VEGIFDINQVYKILKEFMIDRKYRYYEDKDIVKLRKKGVEVNFKGRGERKVDDYAKFELVVEIDTEYMRKVKHEGKLLDQGVIEVVVKSFLYLDYKNEFEYNKWGKFLRKIYNNYIIRFKLPEFYGGKLFVDMMLLHEAIKEVLELYHI